MFRYRWPAIALVSAAAGGASSSAQAPLPATLTTSELFEKVSPCVVKIVAKDEDGRPIGTGSGFAISWMPGSDLIHSRRIVTSYHVISAAAILSIDPPFTDPRLPPVGRAPTLSELESKTGFKISEELRRKLERSGDIRSSHNLTIQDDRDDRASVSDIVAEDKRNDLAVLAGFGFVDPHLTLVEDTVPSIGTRVFVISSPEGLKNTLSEGLVSGVRERENGEKWIQITAPIGPGSSGGPVLTADGKVIGIVVASHEAGQNLNFAVPASALRRLLAAQTEPRPVWKTVSIQEEESDAFSSARVKLRISVCGKEIDKLFGADCRAKVRASEESGDQLALLLKARDESRSDERAIKCEALQTLKRAVEAKPDEYEYLANFLLGKELASIFVCPPCVMQRDSALILMNSATIDEMRAKCYDPAIPLLKKSTQLNPKFSPSFAQLSTIYLETKRYPEALVAAEFLVALVPNCWEAYMMRGKAFAHLKRIGAADEDFATAERLRPNWFDVHKQVYNTFKDPDVGEYRKAFDAMAKALSLPLPTDEKELERRKIDRSLLWYNMGITYEQLGDLDNAARAFEEANRR